MILSAVFFFPLKERRIVRKKTYLSLPGVLFFRFPRSPELGCYWLLSPENTLYILERLFFLSLTTTHTLNRENASYLMEFLLIQKPALTFRGLLPKHTASGHLSVWPLSFKRHIYLLCLFLIVFQTWYLIKTQTESQGSEAHGCLSVLVCVQTPQSTDLKRYQINKASPNEDMDRISTYIGKESLK